MDRLLMDKLVAWKNSSPRKPLVLFGAKRVGKTWLLKEFGRRHFESFIYLSLKDNAVINDLLLQKADAFHCIQAIQIQTGQRLIKGKTLLVLDNLQASSHMLDALKHLCDTEPDVIVAAAAVSQDVFSLKHDAQTLKNAYAKDFAIVDLYPLNFYEFLMATGNSPLAQLLKSGNAALIDVFANKYKAQLRQYFYVGGMPEVVLAYQETGLAEHVRMVQERLLHDIEHDFKVVLPKREAQRIHTIVSSLPMQLSKENKKFMFSHLGQDARARDYHASVSALSKAGLVQQVPSVSKPSLPLSAHKREGSFKLYLLDVGLLAALFKIDKQNILEQTEIFQFENAALVHQYVCQELVSMHDEAPYYWTSANSSGEIDFLFQQTEELFALEVQANENLRAKSLRAFKKAYPDVHAIRISLSVYREEDTYTNVPLYAFSEFLKTKF